MRIGIGNTCIYYIHEISKKFQVYKINKKKPRSGMDRGVLEVFECNEPVRIESLRRSEEGK